MIMYKQVFVIVIYKTLLLLASSSILFYFYNWKICTDKKIRIGTNIKKLLNSFFEISSVEFTFFSLFFYGARLSLVLTLYLFIPFADTIEIRTLDFYQILFLLRFLV